jgi:hypothetical protein
MLIFHCYVTLPEGNGSVWCWFGENPEILAGWWLAQPPSPPKNDGVSESQSG